ncbi:unnamed protein product [Sphenostylis stenocarpa]|uniref:Uncharacterized protein n=1 Tax=Sphenostylis stenocarpa TaxID=92480 RepID=A0AA86T363_9FABA|nr:unnamed protein product [Sphenostylis stenocarpa]
MALALKLKGNFSIFIILSVSLFCLYSETAEDDLQGQSVVKALSCFDNKLEFV